MISKTIICLLILAAVTVTLGRPEKKTRCGTGAGAGAGAGAGERSQDSSSNESDRRDRDESPCNIRQEQDFDERRQHQGDKKNLKIQDTSSSEESQESGRPVKMLTSQEESKDSKRMRNAPEHKPVYHSRQEDYTYSQIERHNEQETRDGNHQVDSNENNSKAGYNRISKY